MLKQEGYALMGAAFEVYNVLGYGMAEEIYHQSLEVELGLRRIPFQSKAELNVTYKDQLLRAVYGPDLLVFDEIVVELKAVTGMETLHSLNPRHQTVKLTLNQSGTLIGPNLH